MVIKLYIENQRLDLFKDENIEVKSAITDAQDVSKNVGDYSKSFTVPASKNNNQIFKHYYNADIDNTFDARVKVSGRIELDGIPFKTGKWRLSKVSVKKGKASAYTINFFGNLVSLKDKFKKDELSALDLSAFNHSYDSANVLTGLQSSLFSGSIVYPPLAKKQYYYSSDPADTTNTDTLSNIAFNGNDVGIIWNDLRAGIKLIDIIEAIETDYDIAFSRDFFGRTEFDNLYLWLNKGKEKTTGGGSVQIDFDGGSSDNINFTTDVGSFFTDMADVAIPRVAWLISTTVVPASGYETVPYTIVLLQDDEEVSRNTYTGQDSNEYFIENDTAVVREIKWYVECEQEFKFTTNVVQFKYEYTGGATVTTVYSTTSSQQTIDSTFTIVDNMPKIKIIDFLRGIFKMFKLVVIPENEESVYVNTIDSYYATGTLYDITKYVDFESYDVERGDIFNEINFNYSEPQTILNKEFENNTGIAYGDEELELADADGEPLDGKTLDVKLPFEQVLYERLTDLFDNAQTNFMYGAIVNEEVEPTNVKPHIFYNVSNSIGGKTIGFIDDVSAVNELTGNINLASHTIDFDSALYSTVWGSEFSAYDGELIENTLYKNYYESYILSVFNVKRRNFKYNAVLPLNILTALQLNDVLKIKQNYYRIDNYTLNLLNGQSKLDLINSFDNDLTGFNANNTVFFIDSNSQRLSSYMTGSDDMTVSKVNEGWGVDWYTPTLVGQNVYIDVEANNTDELRIGKVQILDKINIRFAYILINQKPISSITADNDVITADNNNTTADKT